MYNHAGFWSEVFGSHEPTFKVYKEKENIIRKLSVSAFVWWYQYFSIVPMVSIRVQHFSCHFYYQIQIL